MYIGLARLPQGAFAELYLGLNGHCRIVLPDGDFLVKAGRHSWLVNGELLSKQSAFFKAAIQGSFKARNAFMIELILK